MCECRGGSVYTGDPETSISVSQRITAERLYIARIAGDVGNISFGRAFSVTVEIRDVEVIPHARRLG